MDRYTEKLIREIEKQCKNSINIMEVCGTHTRSIYNYGIKKMLPKNISLMSGPGCPICVTPESYIDKAVNLACNKNLIIVTFGDLLRVPGSFETLKDKKSMGCDIRMVYSPNEVFYIAEENPLKEVVFLAVGFETTAPIFAWVIKKAKEKKIKNLSFLTSIKTMPEILKTVILNSNIDGFIAPGHVAVITGSKCYEDLAQWGGSSMVICGFQCNQILEGILQIIIIMKNSNKVQCKNLYKEAVTYDGNKVAINLINEVFTLDSVYWRGIGIIKDSGLKIKDGYKNFDAEERFNIKKVSEKGEKLCKCGDILMGKKSPSQCEYFKRYCTPDKPKGPCMVSYEGTCRVL